MHVQDRQSWLDKHGVPHLKKRTIAQKRGELQELLVDGRLGSCLMCVFFVYKYEQFNLLGPVPIQRQGFVEEKLLGSASPSTFGRVALHKGEKGTLHSFLGSFQTGNGCVTQSFASLSECTAWIAKMDTSRKMGHMSKGLAMMSKPPVEDQASCLTKR